MSFGKVKLDRRTASLLLAAAALAPVAGKLHPAFGATEQERLVTDIVGRSVALPAHVGRIVLLDARDMLSMAMVHPDPSGLVVGWAGPETFDSDLLRRQYDKFPSGGGPIPIIGGQMANTISLESILALSPDLVVATAHLEPDLDEGVLTRRLTAAGIPVIFSNAASNRASPEDVGQNPIKTLGHVMRMWGAILNREAEAAAFTAFVEQRLAFIRQRLDGFSPLKTYLELQSTYDDCCWAAGTRIWGDLLGLAGGRNLTAVDAPWFAKLSIEQLIVEAPEVYMACGGAFASDIRPAIGPGLAPGIGREGLHRLCQRTGFQTLPAVRDGRVHGIWSGLVSIQPLNILFVEIAAKWLHPEVFRDLKPEETLSEINRRFLPHPIDAPCWLSLQEKRHNG
ncbi:MAG: ABC transporter substrate-binding protein [Nisaea sp.]|uniref:ABC transporter substrate-binding protein n=1 Tax=Nisaea sp. TaxID=2024842 RepID=UPI0032632D64